MNHEYKRILSFFFSKQFLYQVKFTTYYKFSQVFRKILIDFDIDLCDLYKGDIRANVTSLPMSGTNIKGCPMEGFLYAENFNARFSYFPSILQSGSWRMDFAFYSQLSGKSEHLVTARIFVDLKYIGDIKQKVH